MIENFNKVNRFFVFGCSFTRHFYPTWADIIHSEIDKEYHNFGLSGKGNLYILCQLAEQNLRYKFNENDLVMVMFTTFCREDRYLNGYWTGKGNIYNQDFYTEDFVKNYTDPVGYVIQNLAYIEMSNNYLKNLPCQTLGLLSHPIDYMDLREDYSTEEAEQVKKYLSLYEKLRNEFPLSVDEFVEKKLCGGVKNYNLSGFNYKHDGKNKSDPHPNPNTYYNYLLDIKFPLSEKAKKYAEESYTKLLSCETSDDIVTAFPECQKKWINTTNY